MFSFSRKSAQKYAKNISYATRMFKIIENEHDEPNLTIALLKKMQFFQKKTSKKFAGLKFCRTFAIPKQTKRWW